MLEITLENLLRTDLPEFEVRSIPRVLLEHQVCLEPIKDISSFIRDCEADSKIAKVAGSHRINDWEEGWAGKGTVVDPMLGVQVPYYFLNNTHIRLGQKVYKDLSGWTEYYLLRLIQLNAFNELNSMVREPKKLIVEFGCGTGHNLTFLARYFDKTDFWGADWATSAVLMLKQNGVRSKKVDFFNPKTYWRIEQPYFAYTNASLEQCGDEFVGFMDFLISDLNCMGAVHIEPIPELLAHTPLEINSVAYCNKRNYLTGFIEYLQTKAGIRMVERKNMIGSKNLYGYQQVIWTKC